MVIYMPLAAAGDNVDPSQQFDICTTQSGTVFGHCHVTEVMLT